MNKEEVEKNILEKYPTFINKLKELVDLCILKTQFISSKHPDWISNNDTRYSIFGKYVSVLTATRISLYNTLCFVNQDDWIDKYNKELVIDGQKNDFVYLKEMDTQFRFANYMSFVSMFESTVLIIIRFLKGANLRCSDNCYSFVIDNLKITNHKDFLLIVRLLRNTIHNNGVHIPDQRKYDNVHIIFEEIDYGFLRNYKVELNWVNCFSIYEELIKLTEQIIKHNFIEKHKLIEELHYS